MKFSLLDALTDEIKIRNATDKEMELGIERSSKIITVPNEIEINEKIGWLIGFWHAEGRKGKKKHFLFSISNSSFQLIVNCIETLRTELKYNGIINLEIRGSCTEIVYPNLENVTISVDNRDYYKYKSPHFRLEIRSKVFYLIAENLFFHCKTSEEFQRGYVAGFIDGDGYIAKTKYLDIRQEKNERSFIAHNFIKEILQKHGFDVKEYNKKQYRLQVINKVQCENLLIFPLKHQMKVKRLIS